MSSILRPAKLRRIKGLSAISEPPDPNGEQCFQQMNYPQRQPVTYKYSPHATVPQVLPPDPPTTADQDANDNAEAPDHDQDQDHNPPPEKGKYHCAFNLKTTIHI